MQPGVYIFKDRAGTAIYVGKAKSLRHRVRCYFQDSRPPDVKRDRMLDIACDLETILVDNEREATALENNLIKQLKPRYNVLLRDDKSFPFIHLTADRDFPQLTKFRGARDKPGDDDHGENDNHHRPARLVAWSSLHSL